MRPLCTGLEPGVAILADCESRNNMKKSLLSIVCLLAALAGHQAFAAGDATSGESKVAMCGACHGADGNSPSGAFPKLAGLGEKYLVKQMQDIKSGNRPVIEMTGMLDAFSDQDLEDIAAFYDSKPRQLSGAKYITLVGIDNPAEVLKLGEKVYRGGNMETGVASCTGCHSPSGNGNSPAGYPALGGQHAGYIEKQLLMFRNNERTNDGEGKVMQGVAAHMSDKEIKAVANYISGLN